jgi:site-specific recombinase XerD
MIDDMTLRKLSPQTQTAYVRIVKHFARFLGRSPDTASAEDLRRYQLHLVDHGISSGNLNATITGLKCFFETTLECPEAMAKMRHVHEPRKLENTARYSQVAAKLLHEVKGPLEYLEIQSPT